MFRVVKMSGIAYALDISDDMDVEGYIIEAELDNINHFVLTGNPVILCEELEEPEEFGILQKDVEIVEI